MPIMIPNGLPAAKTLADENIFVMNETRACLLYTSPSPRDRG